MDALVVAMVVATVAMALYALMVARDNRNLEAYVEFYSNQLNAATDGWHECADDLREAGEAYRELAEKYQELYGWYVRAYQALERNGLIDEDGNIVGDAE